MMIAAAEIWIATIVRLLCFAASAERVRSTWMSSCMSAMATRRASNCSVEVALSLSWPAWVPSALMTAITGSATSRRQSAARARTSVSSARMSVSSGCSSSSMRLTSRCSSARPWVYGRRLASSPRMAKPRMPVSWSTYAVLSASPAARIGLARLSTSSSWRLFSAAVIAANTPRALSTTPTVMQRATIRRRRVQERTEKTLTGRSPAR
jgi:hypothetical protein